MKKKSANFIRLGDKWLYTDIVKTSAGNIRIGTMPDISKYLAKKKINAKYIVMPPINVTSAGDNYTGEEFVIWNKIFKNQLEQYTYIGEKHNLKFLHNNLKRTINQTFNTDKTKIIKKNRLKKLLKLKIVSPNDKIKLSKRVFIEILPSNIVIYEDEKPIYNYLENKHTLNINQEVDILLKPFKKKLKKIPYIDIIPIGVGNGFYGNTANFLIHYGTRLIWVDVMAKPFLALKKLKIHWDNVTDYFISHIHEDHIEGLSAVLTNAIYKNKKVNIITTNKIMKDIKKRFYYLFPDINNIVNHINIIPDIDLPYYHGILNVRLNHHVLKSGTLGLKIKYHDNCVAISGDTLYSAELAKKFPDKKAFDINWFSDCQLVFHEVSFKPKNKFNVHTHYTELKNLQKQINGKILGYHISENKKLFPTAKEFKHYIIKNKKVHIK